MEMQLESLEKRQAARNEVNWVTAIFMMAFHVGAIAALFFSFTLGRRFLWLCSCGGFRAAWVSA